MFKALLAGVGGFIGTLLRYGAHLAAQRWVLRDGFPYGTLAVNLSGCLIIGFLSYLAQARDVFTVEVRTFIFIGVLGGFTTFSSFGNETVELWRAGRESFSIINIAAHLVLGLGAVWLGRAIASLVG